MKIELSEAIVGVEYVGVWTNSHSWADYTSNVFDNRQEAVERQAEMEEEVGSWEAGEEYHDTGYTVEECAPEEIGEPRAKYYIASAFVKIDKNGERSWEKWNKN